MRSLSFYDTDREEPLYSETKHKWLLPSLEKRKEINISVCLRLGSCERRLYPDGRPLTRRASVAFYISKTFQNNQYRVYKVIHSRLLKQRAQNLSQTVCQSFTLRRIGGRYSILIKGCKNKNVSIATIFIRLEEQLIFYQDIATAKHKQNRTLISKLVEEDRTIESLSNDTD